MLSQIIISVDACEGLKLMLGHCIIPDFGVPFHSTDSNQPDIVVVL